MFAFSIQCSETQSCFAGGFGQGGHAAVILVLPRSKQTSLMPAAKARSAMALPTAVGRRLVAAVFHLLLQCLFGRAGGSQRAALLSSIIWAYMCLRLRKTHNRGRSRRAANALAHAPGPPLALHVEFVFRDSWFS